MAEIVSVQTAEDRRDVIHRVVQALADGGLVALPTETTYLLAAHGLQSEAVKRLADCAGTGMDAGSRLPLTLLVRGADEAWDYVPDMPAHGRRLALRCWPGPVVLQFAGTLDRGLLRALPASVRQAVYPGGVLSLRSVANDIVRAVLELTPSPLVAEPEPVGPDARSTTASAVAERHRERVGLVVDDGPIPQRSGGGATVVAVEPSGWRVERSGVVPESKIAELAGRWFLFVCTGNTCRSPMAAALFRRFLAERLGCEETTLPQRGFVALSAGISAAMGAPASAEAIEVMRQKGIDLSGHRSQPVTMRLLQQADHVFTMTRTHRDILVASCPEAADRIQVLASDGRDVSDPFGWGTEEYKRCEAEIERYVRSLVEQLPLTEPPER